MRERVEETREQLSICQEEKKRCINDTTAKFDSLIHILTLRRSQCLELIGNKYEKIESNLKQQVFQLEEELKRLQETIRDVRNPEPIHLDVKRWTAYPSELQRLQNVFSDAMHAFNLSIKSVGDILREPATRWRVRVRFEEDLTEKLYRYGKVKEVSNRDYKPQTRVISGKSEHVNLEPRYRVVCDTLRGLEVGDMFYFNKLLYLLNVTAKSYCVFSAEGDFLEEVFYRDHVPVDKCKEAIAVSKQFIYVVSWRINSVLAYSHQGQMMKCVSSIEKLGEFNSPFYPCIDSEGELVLADRLNKRIVRLSQSLTAGTVSVRDDNIDKIFSMHVDENDFLILAYPKCIKFYSLQGEPIAQHELTHLFPKMFHFRPSVMCPLPFGFIVVGDYEWMFLYHQDEDRIYYLRTKHQFLSYTAGGLLCTATHNSLNFFDIASFL